MSDEFRLKSYYEVATFRLKEKMGEKAIVLKLDIDKSPYYSQLYNIHSVPTLIIFKEWLAKEDLALT